MPLHAIPLTLSNKAIETQKKLIFPVDIDATLAKYNISAEARQQFINSVDHSQKLEIEILCCPSGTLLQRFEDPLADKPGPWFASPLVLNPSELGLGQVVQNAFRMTTDRISRYYLTLEETILVSSVTAGIDDTFSTTSLQTTQGGACQYYLIQGSKLLTFGDSYLGKAIRNEIANENPKSLQYYNLKGYRMDIRHVAAAMLYLHLVDPDFISKLCHHLNLELLEKLDSLKSRYLSDEDIYYLVSQIRFEKHYKYLDKLTIKLGDEKNKSYQSLPVEPGDFVKITVFESLTSTRDKLFLTYRKELVDVVYRKLSIQLEYQGKFTGKINFKNAMDFYFYYYLSDNRDELVRACVLELGRSNDDLKKIAAEFRHALHRAIVQISVAHGPKVVLPPVEEEQLVATKVIHKDSITIAPNSTHFSPEKITETVKTYKEIKIMLQDAIKKVKDPLLDIFTLPEFTAALSNHSGYQSALQFARDDIYGMPQLLGMKLQTIMPSSGLIDLTNVQNMIAKTITGFIFHADSLLKAAALEVRIEKLINEDPLKQANTLFRKAVMRKTEEALALYQAAFEIVISAVAKPLQTAVSRQL